MGNTPCRFAVVHGHAHRIHGHLRRRGMRAGPASTRASEISAGNSEITNWLVACAMPDHPVAQLAIGGNDPQVRGANSGLAPRLTLADRHHFARRLPRRLRASSTTSIAAGSGDHPAEHLVGCLVGTAPRFAHRRNERQLPQHIDQLFHRAHEVATRQLLCFDDLGEALPCRPRIRHCDERRVRRAVHRQAGFLLDLLELVADLGDSLPALAHGRRREPRGRRRLGAAMLVDEDRHQACQRCRLEIVEQTLAQTFDDQQVAFVKRLRQDLAGVGQAPAVDVAPVLQHPQHPVEVTSHRLAASAHASTELFDFTGNTLGLRGGLQAIVELRIVLDGMRSIRGNLGGTTRLSRVRHEGGELQTVDDLFLEVVAVGGVVGRELDLAECPRRLGEVELRSASPDRDVPSAQSLACRLCDARSPARRHGRRSGPSRRRSHHPAVASSMPASPSRRGQLHRRRPVAGSPSSPACTRRCRRTGCALVPAGRPDGSDVDRVVPRCARRRHRPDTGRTTG